MSQHKTILVVLTSHGTLGNTGKPTGYYLPELSHALAEFSGAGLAVDFASPQGGKPPMDGVDRKDPKNAAVLDDATLMHRLATTKKVADVDIAAYDAFYKRLIERVPLSDVSSSFAMEEIKSTTALPLPAPD